MQDRPKTPAESKALTVTHSSIYNRLVLENSMMNEVVRSDLVEKEKWVAAKAEKLAQQAPADAKKCAGLIQHFTSPFPDLETEMHAKFGRSHDYFYDAQYAQLKRFIEGLELALIVRAIESNEKTKTHPECIAAKKELQGNPKFAWVPKEYSNQVLFEFIKLCNEELAKIGMMAAGEGWARYKAGGRLFPPAFSAKKGKAVLPDFVAADLLQQTMTKRF